MLDVYLCVYVYMRTAGAVTWWYSHPLAIWAAAKSQEEPLVRHVTEEGGQQNEYIQHSAKKVR
jgi:hypothetical protein